MKFLAYLFDLDGTLIDSLPDIAGVVNVLRARYGGRRLFDREVLPAVGFGADRLMKDCVAPLPGTPSIENLVGEYRETYRSFVPKGALYTGVKETLTQLRSKKGVRLAIVTNKPSSAAEITLAKYLPELKFDEIAGPDRVTAHKPHPAHALEVLNRLNVSPEDAVFIGDHEVDRACATGAGVMFLGACYGLCGVKVPENRRLNSFSELIEKSERLGV